MTNKQDTSVEWEFNDYLSKAFLQVHHGKLLPIDVIEKIQEHIRKAKEKAEQRGYDRAKRELQPIQGGKEMKINLSKVSDISLHLLSEIMDVNKNIDLIMLTKQQSIYLGGVVPLTGYRGVDIKIVEDTSKETQKLKGDL